MTLSSLSLFSHSANHDLPGTITAYTLPTITVPCECLELCLTGHRLGSPQPTGVAQPPACPCSLFAAAIGCPPCQGLLSSVHRWVGLQAIRTGLQPTRSSSPEPASHRSDPPMRLHARLGRAWWFYSLQLTVATTILGFDSTSRSGSSIRSQRYITSTMVMLKIKFTIYIL